MDDFLKFYVLKAEFDTHTWQLKECLLKDFVPIGNLELNEVWQCGRARNLLLHKEVCESQELKGVCNGFSAFVPELLVRHLNTANPILYRIAGIFRGVKFSWICLFCHSCRSCCIPVPLGICMLSQKFSSTIPITYSLCCPSTSCASWRPSGKQQKTFHQWDSCT